MDGTFVEVAKWILAVGGAIGLVVVATMLAIVYLLRELRMQREGDRVTTDYSKLVDELQEEIGRLRLQQNSLGGVAKQQVERLRLLEAEARIAREDRARLVMLLGQVKREQEKMIASGELHDPLVDIPTEIVRDRGL